MCIVSACPIWNGPTWAKVWIQQGLQCPSLSLSPIWTLDSKSQAHLIRNIGDPLLHYKGPRAKKFWARWKAILSQKALFVIHIHMGPFGVPRCSLKQYVHTFIGSLGEPHQFMRRWESKDMDMAHVYTKFQVHKIILTFWYVSLNLMVAKCIIFIFYFNPPVSRFWIGVYGIDDIHGPGGGSSIRISHRRSDHIPCMHLSYLRASSIQNFCT